MGYTTLDDAQRLAVPVKPKTNYQASSVPTTQLTRDQGNYQEYAHVHWYVGNDKQASKSLR